MAKRGKRAPSMKDVAKLAGVSQTTVSFVINNVPNTNIPQETQERILEAVQVLGYRPNALARGLRSQTTQTIGIISDDIATTPYAGRVIQGAQDAAWAQEKLILLINTGRDKRMKQAAAEALLDRQVDGILYATMYHRPVSPPRIVWEVPTVLVDCFVEDGSLPSVVPDEVRGAYAATELLILRGHGRIGFLNNQDPIPATAGRLQGYRLALADYHLSEDDSLIWSGASQSAGGYAGAMALLARSDRPTALFCFNDRMAMGAYQAIAELGLAIPQDVAVVGFDNHEVIAAWLRPPLTSMELPHYAMGQWAVQHLMELIAQPTAAESLTPQQHSLPCPLIERESA